MTPDLGMTGWVGVHPHDGGDVAHLLLYPTTAGPPDVAAKLRVAAGLYGLRTGAPPTVPAEVTSVAVTAGWVQLLHAGQLVVERPITAEWSAVAATRGLVLLSLGEEPYDGRADTLDPYLDRMLRRRRLHVALVTAR